MSNLVQALTGCDILHHLLCACRTRRFVIHTIQAGQERQAARQHRLDRKPQQKPEVVQCSRFHGIGRRHKHSSILCLERKHVKAAGEMDRHLLNPFMVDLAHIKIREPGKFKLNGKSLEKLIFGNRPESDQDFSETPPFGLLKVDCLKQFGFGQAKFVFEDRSQQRPTGLFVVYHRTPNNGWFIPGRAHQAWDKTRTLWSVKEYSLPDRSDKVTKTPLQSSQSMGGVRS